MGSHIAQGLVGRKTRPQTTLLREKVVVTRRLLRGPVVDSSRSVMHRMDGRTVFWLCGRCDQDHGGTLLVPVRKFEIHYLLVLSGIKL